MPCMTAEAHADGHEQEQDGMTPYALAEVSGRLAITDLLRNT